MNDDKIVKDTARDPEREALGPMRGGVRAAAKGAARKVAKSVKSAGQKKTVRRTTATAGRATKKAAKSAAKTDKPAPAKAATPTSRKPPPATRAGAAATKTGAAAAEAASAASGAAFASEPAAAGFEDASRSVAGTGTPATPEAPLPEPGPSIEMPRPPAPMHPGAFMDPTQEQAGGLGSVLALWGPLIIVGFLVLVFLGGEERGSTVAAGPGAMGQAAADVPAETMREPPAGSTVELADGSVEPAAGARSPERIPGSPGAARGVAEAFDGGFTMRTSMASPPALPSRALAGRGSGVRMPAGAPGRLYPSPPGPYRDPQYRGLPTGESWSAAGAGEWLWPAEGPEAPRHEDGADPSVQWVPCAPPYYWCPAPSSPAW